MDIVIYTTHLILGSLKDGFILWTEIEAARPSNRIMF